MVVEYEGVREGRNSRRVRHDATTGPSRAVREDRAIGHGQAPSVVGDTTTISHIDRVAGDGAVETGLEEGGPLVPEGVRPALVVLADPRHPAVDALGGQG